MIENPILQRELLVNLRKPSAFAGLFLYVLGVSLVVFFAWPQDQLIQSGSSQAAQRLMQLFFLGQFALAVVLVPVFAAGAFSGEKEGKTYELLLTCPVPPRSMLWGKLLGSLSQIMVLIFATLPIIVICLPLGGMSVWEMLGMGALVIAATITCGMVALAASCYFSRTAAALAVSYLVLLPLVFMGIGYWQSIPINQPPLALLFAYSVLPLLCLLLSAVLYLWTTQQLLHPRDVGSEGAIVIEEERQQRRGQLILRRDKFPDYLFAPAKRGDVMPDGVNPVFDKEMRSEVFSQGTLMLRFVIQSSFLLAIPLMFQTLYLRPVYAAYFPAFIILYNLLVTPVFLAGAVSGERERGTLDLLLTTNLRPSQILFGKLLAGVRISMALTSLLVYPLLLGCVMSSYMRSQLYAGGTYIVLVILAGLTTAMLSIFCSVFAQRTVHSMAWSYLAITLLFFGPLAAVYFLQTFYSDTTLLAIVAQSQWVSPIYGLFRVPLDFDIPGGATVYGSWTDVGTHIAATLVFNVLVFGLMVWIFHRNWRISGEGQRGML